MDKEIEESKNKNIKYKIANEAVIKRQINKIHEHEKKAEQYLKQLEELEDKSKNLIKFIKKKDEELEVKKFDIDIITRKLENKNIELENKDIELNKKKNELKNIKFDSVASRKNLIKYLQDEKNIDQIDGKKFIDSGDKYLSIEDIKKYYLDNFSRTELLKYFSKYFIKFFLLAIESNFIFFNSFSFIALFKFVLKIFPCFSFLCCSWEYFFDL